MKVTPLTASTFRSDGGAMFGLVPKPLWSRVCPPNDHNGIAQRANVLLVELPDGRKGLVDSGCGDPAWISAREREMHGMEAGWLLRDGLAALGIGFDEIKFVVLTHAHWDHAGGLCDPDGNPVFPNAGIYMRESEFNLALSRDPLLYKSYPLHITRALEHLSDRMHLTTDATTEVVPGLHLLPAAGHTGGQGCVLITAPHLPGLDTPPTHVLFPGDNCPTQHHLRLVFQTAYDTLPLQTRAWKRAWWPRCAREDILVLFCHDADNRGAWIEVHPDSGEYRVRQTYGD